MKGASTVSEELSKDIARPITQDTQHMLNKIIKINKNIIYATETKLIADLQGILVPSKKFKRAEKTLKQLREEEWQEALKKANGNEEKAFEIFNDV